MLLSTPQPQFTALFMILGSYKSTIWVLCRRFNNSLTLTHNMNTHITAIFIALIFPTLLIAQSNDYDPEMKWIKGWTNFTPNQTYYPEPDQQLPQIIDTDTYLTSDTTYAISGNVYVANNATLTIQEGTVIRCDHRQASSLIVAKGAKLIARGLKNQPIVFTSSKDPKSRKSGDWGGIIIIGSSSSNSPSGSGIIKGNYIPQYSVFGGTKTDEMTTVMTYVRIEFAGKKINASEALNGLSLYAAGSNSIINHIMVSYSGDDSFELFGGTSDLTHLISYKAKDDDFDFSLGYKGTLLDIIAVRHPYISDISGSYAIEADGFDKEIGMLSQNTLSHIKINNATLINLSDDSNFQHTTAAISSKNLAKIDCKESKISGFANVLKLDNSYTSFIDLKKSFAIENCIFNIHNKNILVQYQPHYGAEKILQYNMFTTNFKKATELFENPLDPKNPKFNLKGAQKSYTMMR